ncbi:Acetyltransferase [Vibrio chagasii]|nr:Acetyltransferase [Vibrio chagasii]CAH7127939.1 Acetyltransferase [Vibrio chagasii]CAH7196175.1 Acetyltransferase [Vibrio chagasii]CAH7383575.1 Acetyltransferase [Vibrio chagasii]
MIKKISLSIYYLFLKHFPRNEMIFFGTLSCLLRRLIVKFIFKSCGRGVNVNRGAYFGSGLNISIGDNSSIGENCKIANDTGIGNDVMMAPEVLIFSVTHETKEINLPMRIQGNKSPRSVRIGNNVWIGQRAIILPGVTIHDGAIVAAGSIVTKDVCENEVVAGNPARVVKVRK